MIICVDKIHTWSSFSRVIISFKQIYRQMKTLAEPRDNKDIFPPKGNLHESSYRRIGADDEGTGVSETHAMLSQIEMRDEYKPITYPRRSLLTMQSLASAEYVSFLRISRQNYSNLLVLKIIILINQMSIT